MINTLYLCFSVSLLDLRIIKNNKEADSAFKITFFLLVVAVSFFSTSFSVLFVKLKLKKKSVTYVLGKAENIGWNTENFILNLVLSMFFPDRSSRPEVFCKDVLKNSPNSQENTRGLPTLLRPLLLFFKNWKKSALILEKMSWLCWSWILISHLKCGFMSFQEKKAQNLSL